MGAFKDLTGQRFGRLVVIECVGHRGEKTLWECKCDCGEDTKVISHSLIGGDTKSCGCYSKERSTTHGMRGTKIYSVWKDMKGRCNNPNDKGYQDYGGRGITVCDGWLEFIHFYNWAMANGYSNGLTIDRVDNNSGYSPENCRWSTWKEQENNKRSNVWIKYQGERKTMAQWADTCGISRGCLHQRIKAGWTIEKAFNTPTRIYENEKGA